MARHGSRLAWRRRCCAWHRQRTCRRAARGPRRRQRARRHARQRIENSAGCGHPRRSIRGRRHRRRDPRPHRTADAGDRRKGPNGRARPHRQPRPRARRRGGRSDDAVPEPQDHRRDPGLGSRRGGVGTPPGRWIWTPRVFPTRVRERRFPTRDELDAASPSHPVVVDGAYGLMLNTAALRAADITAATPDPPGGAIVRDAAGAPTGLLRNVGGLLARFRTDRSAEVPLDLLEQVHRAYNKVGITSVIERQATKAGVPGVRAPAPREPPARPRDGDDSAAAVREPRGGAAVHRAAAIQAG